MLMLYIDIYVDNYKILIYIYLSIIILAYIKAAAALCIITLLTDLVATILTGLGLRTKEHHSKYKYYRFAVIVMGLARKYSIIICIHSI